MQQSRNEEVAASSGRRRTGEDALPLRMPGGVCDLLPLLRALLWRHLRLGVLGNPQPHPRCIDRWSLLDRRGGIKRGKAYYVVG